jgi:RimJ/RimL family protein N-acetyltransferase
MEIAAIPLETRGVRLEPLREDHRAGLRRAADTPEIWTHMPTPAHGARFDPWFDWSLKISADGTEAVWAVFHDDRPVGSTRFLSIERQHRRVEIGHTWYAPEEWASTVNPASKYLLLRYAFETLALNRVELKTDNRNLRSQAAIAKLGAQREGVFRAHMIRADGSLRDTVYFSIIRDEWPAVRARLEARLSTLATTRELQ